MATAKQDVGLLLSRLPDNCSLEVSSTTSTYWKRFAEASAKLRGTELRRAK
jgi:hypothetical protein